ncbi:MAG TPA: flavodoxin family protein, partial [Hyphomicrobiaceae bacterium]|nr:flavodoxin family protein [Hyphomicrobiaceae bacterium]
KPHVIHGANRVSPEQYARIEGAFAERLSRLAHDEPIPYRSQNGGDYDDDLVLKPGLEGTSQGFAMRIREQR